MLMTVQVHAAISLQALVPKRFIAARAVADAWCSRVAVLEVNRPQACRAVPYVFEQALLVLDAKLAEVLEACGCGLHPLVAGQGVEQLPALLCGIPGGVATQTSVSAAAAAAAAAGAAAAEINVSAERVHAE